MSDYYNHSSIPSNKSIGSSAAMRAEFDAIQTGISDKLAPLTGNGGKLVGINTGATAQEAVSTTGTGDVVRSTSPTLVTPELGTPTSVTLTNATGFPAAIYQRSNILGTVSQSAGVPTGAIIESGSNANGTYVRYANGTQICTSVAVLSTTTAKTWVTGSSTLPATFIDTTYTCVSSMAGIPSNQLIVTAAQAGTTSAASISLISESAVTASIKFIAIGRWF